MLLVIDNYDSFVHNLARYFQRLGHKTLVMRNDAVSVAAVRALHADALVFSPGPGTPGQAGRSLQIVRELADELPMLGVCLGHQTIAEALGGKVVRACRPMHGRASKIRHNGTGVLTGLASPLTVGRYHSLAVDPQSLPAELEAIAWAEDDTLMAFQHVGKPLIGLQFHPESVLTECGYAILAGFLRSANLAVPDTLPVDDHDRLPSQDRQPPWPPAPITF